MTGGDGRPVPLHRRRRRPDLRSSGSSGTANHAIVATRRTRSTRTTTSGGRTTSPSRPRTRPASTRSRRPATSSCSRSSSIAFSASPLSGTYPLDVTFKDESADAAKWTWDFGDGTTSTQENPTKTYANVGTYDVTLDDRRTSTGSEGHPREDDYITGRSGLCQVPNFFNVSTDDAQALWGERRASRRRSSSTRRTLPWPIKSQDIVGASVVPCNSTITVKKN